MVMSNPAPSIAPNVPGERRLVGPAESVVVERIGDRHQLRQRRRHRRCLSRPSSVPKCSRYFSTASASSAASPPEQLIVAIERPGSGPWTCNSFSVSSSTGIAPTPRHPGAAQERVHYRIGAGERRGMADGEAGAGRRASGLERDHRDAHSPRMRHSAGEGSGSSIASIWSPIAVTPRIVGQRRDHVGKADDGLVAQRHQNARAAAW